MATKTVTGCVVNRGECGETARWAHQTPHGDVQPICDLHHRLGCGAGCQRCVPLAQGPVADAVEVTAEMQAGLETDCAGFGHAWGIAYLVDGVLTQQCWRCDLRAPFDG